MAKLFWTTYALWLASELWILLRDRAPVASVSRDAGSRRVVMAAIIAGVLLAFMATRVHAAASPWSRPQGDLVGAAIMLAGIAFRLWAVRSLGEHFRTQVTLLDAHRLIRSGPYARVRHPAYTGAIVTCLGLGIALANWLSLLALVVLPLAGIVWRVAIEERALDERFGGEWRGYRAQSWAMLPPVW